MRDRERYVLLRKSVAMVALWLWLTRGMVWDQSGIERLSNGSLDDGECFWCVLSSFLWSRNNRFSDSGKRDADLTVSEAHHEYDSSIDNTVATWYGKSHSRTMAYQRNRPSPFRKTLYHFEKYIHSIISDPACLHSLLFRRSITAILWVKISNINSL